LGAVKYLEESTVTANDKVTLLLDYLEKYFARNINQVSEIKDIINQEYVIDPKFPNNKISLRILDFFITTYSKKFNLKIQKDFNVYQNYRLALKSFHKSSFDPFCRKHKLTFYYGKKDDEYVESSAGQLSFFKWCFENGIIEYVKKNYNVIDDSMKKSSPKRKKVKGPVTIQFK
jgi:hypothetical protein